jgi:putative ABC transport system permease protein
MHDLRFAFRQMCRSPGFTAVALFTLALGVGATTTVLSAIKATVLKPLPVSNPDRYLEFLATHKQQGWTASGLPPVLIEELRQHTNLFRRTAVYEWDQLTLQGTDFPELLHGLRVTPSFFGLWSVQPTLGRTFAEAEAQAGHNAVVIISHRLWQTRFGGDPQIVGRAIRCKELSMTVVGVMPSYFRFPNKDFDYWRPSAMPSATDSPVIASANDWMKHPGVIAEMQPGVSLREAQALLDVLWQQQAPGFTDSAEFKVEARELRARFSNSPMRPTLSLLLPTVILVLLIGAANIANLQLVRTESRWHELAVRTALGAGHLRIVWQMLTENLLLAVLGGMASLLIVHFGLAVLEQRFGSQARMQPLALDATSLWLAASTALVTGFLFGLAPLVRCIRAGPAGLLKDGARATSQGRSSRWVSQCLVVGQVAVALVLLTGAGLMIRSVIGLLHVDPGFDLRNLVYVYPRLDVARYTSNSVAGATGLDLAFAEMRRRVTAIPGVEGVGIALLGAFDLAAAGKEGTSCKLNEAYVAAAEANPLAVMRVPLLQGRWLTPDDSATAVQGVLVNETAARVLWPGQSPLGQQLRCPDRKLDHSFSVVGVVRDTRTYGYWDAPKPTMFRVLAGAPVGGPPRYLVVRAHMPAAALSQAIRPELKAVGADAAAPVFISLEQQHANATARHREQMRYLSLFALLAMALAALGIYGVLSYAVVRRTREIGICMALGATRPSVLWMVVRQGMTLVGVGLVLGLGAACALTRLLRGMLYGVSPLDPLSLAAGALLLGLVAFLACYLPARRATRVDPVVALRYE